ncbi:hypothetical protein V2G26_017552 [Clonostachys chloroleuca]
MFGTERDDFVAQRIRTNRTFKPTKWWLSLKGSNPLAKASGLLNLKVAMSDSPLLTTTSPDAPRALRFASRLCANLHFTCAVWPFIVNEIHRIRAGFTSILHLTVQHDCRAISGISK